MTGSEVCFGTAVSIAGCTTESRQIYRREDRYSVIQSMQDRNIKEVEKCIKF